jgi:nucleotide-binding universal stress UspA family protein
MRWSADGLSEKELDEAKIRFVCAYDGSEVAKSALGLLLDYILPKRKNAEATAVYVDDPSKTYLPPAQRRDAVQHQVSMSKFLFPNRLDSRVLYKDGEKCAGQTICEYANENRADFLVIGMYGRKGIKDQTEAVMASNANYALTYGQCSTILIQEPFLPYSQVHFLVAMDRTKSSEKALVDALLLSEPDDTITLLHIVMRDEQNRLNDAKEDPLKAYKEKLAPLIATWTTNVNRPRRVKVVFQAESEKPVAEDILDYAANNNVHVVCVGANVSRLRENKHFMGSTSTCVMTNCVRQGVPVVIAHYDERFAEVGGSDWKAPEYEPLPPTAQFATPGPAAA